MFDLAQNLTTGPQGPSYGTKNDPWGAARNYSRPQNVTLHNVSMALEQFTFVGKLDEDRTQPAWNTSLLHWRAAVVRLRLVLGVRGVCR